MLSEERARERTVACREATGPCCFTLLPPHLRHHPQPDSDNLYRTTPAPSLQALRDPRPCPAARPSLFVPCSEPSTLIPWRGSPQGRAGHARAVLGLEGGKGGCAVQPATTLPVEGLSLPPRLLSSASSSPLRPNHQGHGGRALCPVLSALAPAPGRNPSHEPLSIPLSQPGSQASGPQQIETPGPTAAPLRPVSIPHQLLYQACSCLTRRATARDRGH